MGLGEGDQQHPDTHHDPGLIGVPKGANRGDHGVFLGIGTKRQQHTHAEIKAIQYHIEQQRQAHR